MMSFLLMVSSGKFATAQDVARVRTELVSESPVWVGQRTTFMIELMSATLFSGTARFDLPEIPGLIIMKVAGSPSVSSDRIDGDTWSIQTHRFSVFAHRPGNYEIPEFPVRFSVAPAFGKPPEEQNLASQPFSFEARMPPGAEGLSLLISTENLQVEETWQPPVTDDGKIQLEVGDAINRTITLQATDVPGMALPPISFPKPAGLAAYSGSPEVADHEERGSLTGQRSDSITYVCEGPGTFEMPAVAIPWWDMAVEKLERITLPAVSITVVDNSPQESATGEAPGSSEVSRGGWMVRNRAWLAATAVVLVLAGLYWAFCDRIRNWIAMRRERYDNSETARFAKVKKACAKNDPVAALNAVMRWLEFEWSGSNAVTIDAFLRRHPDDALASELSELQRAAMQQSNAWSGQELSAKLTTFRIDKIRPRTLPTQQVLPPLNPGR
ncbi:MAG: BatD family protein [Pirellulaceae bacterium]